MRVFQSLLIIALLAPEISIAQNKTAQYRRGWPDPDGGIDIRSGFVNPPKGYGNVPFYWWSGDDLDIERMTEQLKILSGSSTDGLCVSYIHSHPGVDKELNAQGYGGFGRLLSGEPKVLSSEWMKLWADFSGRCAEYDMALGLDDYVIASPGNGFAVDEVLSSPSFKSFQGRLHKRLLSKKDPLPENLLTYKYLEDSIEVFYTTPSPELHPDYGRLMVEKYFQPFEDAMGAKGRNGMNYFFQDELIYNLTIHSWCDSMREIFLERKGYDIIPHLDALFIVKDDEVTPDLAKIRLDYAEVLTQLAEERYFKPIFDWHDTRGLIYGCDNYGRGLRPTQYLDYFRATSWFTAPGNDAPARGSSFRQTKVSSSISHLYGRPRTWLEAFHSMGWDANGKLLTRQLDHHLIAGGNLLCLHGLYYTTHGGWWEWAPPSFHFRMPYWPHMKEWLRYAERMSFVLSQGRHVCDLAILYPTETMQAYPESKPDLMFKTAMDLSEKGLDYDFIDYQSLQNADVSGGVISVPDEKYKVLILAGIRALHPETMKKIQDFERQGGIIVRIHSEDQIQNLAESLRGRIMPDFQTGRGVGKVLHRRVADRDVYFVMDVTPGDIMIFRSTGKAEIWDAMHGTTTPVPVIRCENGCSTIRYEGEEGGSALIVFSPGQPLMEKQRKSGPQNKNNSERVAIPVEGKWDVEIVPTLDNRWGDYRLPKSDGMIGVEARKFTCRPSGYNREPISSVYGYAPYMQTLEIPSTQDLDSVLHDIHLAEGWKPYVFSWQYGVFDSPGSQGYHGLKERVDDCFLILDKGCHQIFSANLSVPETRVYKILQRGVQPYRVIIDGNPVEADSLKLSRGIHSLIIAYSSTGSVPYSLEKMRGRSVDRRDRSMVMLYPDPIPELESRGMNGSIVSSSWYGTPFVPFVCTGVSRWELSFSTAPGTRKMLFETFGTIDNIKVDGADVPFTRVGNGLAADGCTTIKYIADNLPVNSGVAEVMVTASPDESHPAASFFAEPVKLDCKGGKMDTGDWSLQGSMMFFSGGVRYSKTVVIKKKGRIWLDLGDVEATCEVWVNGKKADVLVKPPFKLDISKFSVKGKNLIEVLVYSSLSNHYQTIPSPYRGEPKAGLIGPVRLYVEK